MGQTAEEADALHEGIPPWMATALWAWITDRVSGSTRSGYRVPFPEVVDKFEQARRSRNPITENFENLGVETLKTSWSADRDVLPFVDFLICEERNKHHEPASLAELEQILVACGSAWKVGTRERYPGLERRVALGVQEVADHVMSTAGDAGLRLSEAWHAVFGLNPDPWKAYSKAVLAVEDAALPGVSPKDKDRTLGKAIGAIRDQGWELPTPKPDERTPTVEVLRHMLGMLWYGHGERHGGAVDPDTKISQEDAETAVLLAVPLVQWFSSGAARRPDSN
jgi:hypothetical protein